MDDKKKVVLLLIAAAILVGLTLWMVVPARDDLNLPGLFLGDDGGDGVTENGPPMEIDTDKDYSAVIVTERGDFTIDLYEENAPVTVNNFVYLSNIGYYSQCNFHRVVKGFLVQTGLTPDGREPEYTIGDEINADSLGLDSVKVSDADWLTYIYDPSDESTDPFKQENLKEYSDYTVKAFLKEAAGYSYRTDIESKKAEVWSVGMANDGPNTASSQFFVITGGATRHLDGRYTIFGEVVEGKETIQIIENLGAEQVEIIDIQISEK